MGIEKIAEELEDKSAQEVLHWAAQEYSNIAIASSFSAEDVVLIDMIVKEGLPIKVFTLDTGRLPEETYKVMEQIKTKYDIDIDVYFPNEEAVEKLEREKGLYSFKESIANRKECCEIRKVEPLERALSGLDAWVTGLRREQAVTREKLEKIEVDDVNWKIIKINPLADWNEQKVWDYIKDNDVPYNELHDKGYPSVGCEPCTRAVKPGESIRAGRWWWENPEHKECGIHAR